MIDLVPYKDVSYCGIEMKLRYTLGALHRIEGILGRGARLDAAGLLPMEDFRAILWACGDQVLTLEETGRRVTVQHLNRLVFDVSTLIRASTQAVPSTAADGQEKPEAGRMDWLDLWSIARVDMNLSTEEFWRLTPAMYLSLLTRVRRKYGIEDEPTPEQRAKSVLEKVIAINAMMGGKDLRGVKA